MATRRLEVHRHAIVSGPRANKSWCNEIVHSHDGGDLPHAHENTGPGSYTIDRDEWYARTGLKGGGRKKFTSTPTGEQLAPMTFEVICLPGHAPNAAVERIELATRSKAVR